MSGGKNFFLGQVVWQPWKRSDASILAARNDLEKLNLFSLKAIKRFGKNGFNGFVKVWTINLVSLFRAIYKYFTKNFDFRTRLGISADASKRKVNKHETDPVLGSEPGLFRPQNTLGVTNPDPWLEPETSLNYEPTEKPLAEPTRRRATSLLPTFSLSLSLSTISSFLSLSLSSVYSLSSFNQLRKPKVNLSLHIVIAIKNYKTNLDSVSSLKIEQEPTIRTTDQQLRQAVTRNNSQSNSQNKCHDSCKPLNLTSFYRSGRHRQRVIRNRIRLGNDVEENPGPENREAGELRVTTYNVRGLNDDKKLRHLINYCYQESKKCQDQVLCFQETYLTNPGIIPYLWRGNYFLTPGRGNSLGCLTLLSSHLNIVSAKSISDRAHVLVCKKVGETSHFIVANVYAPNANNVEKIDFFEKIFEAVSELELAFTTSHILLTGDFNLTFNSKETKNRSQTSQERNVAKSVMDMLLTFELADAWKDKKGFSWKRANSDSFSRIDRCFYSSNHLRLLELKTNWSLSMSDHAAVEVTLTAAKEAEANVKTKFARIDPTLFTDPALKERILSELENFIAMAPGDWNPHMRLDYLKMSLRTICEKVQAERKRKEKSEEELLNAELELAIKALERPNVGLERRVELIDYVEELRAKKSIMIDAKGVRLAGKLRTKWYNEGEKSTRYFLRILERKNPDKFTQIQDEAGNILENQGLIEAEIISFYKNLYETYDKTKLEVTPDPSFFDEIISVTGEQQQEVVAPITIDDLAKTLSTLKDSSPGPDGIPYSVWKATWRVSGKIICEAWSHSVVTGKLPPSHKVSYLKLIPKADKDTKKLTNWRPITLSNCDHKLITKTYANRICEKVASSISENQTAYLKGRIIHDNIRALLTSVKVANLENNIDSVLVSLDAKKAFDSVEHGYIEKCLSKFGLEQFIGIFRTLYNELRSDVIINSKVVNGFKILRGVKQGDALSCVLFIMCMEPLLRNIDKNHLIPNVNSTLLQAELPKVAAYADDVSCLTQNNQVAVQEIFNEYARLTNLSGLELNADKTEILNLVSRNVRQDPNGSIDINYCGKNFNINFSREVKINGLLFQNNIDAMKQTNLERAIGRMDSQFRKWSRRSLSILGKILIVKTFGISQIIFLLQCLNLETKHFKQINAVLYKFIWNKHYLSAKAPERISRTIVNKPIKLGGLGMIDVIELDCSLKLRALGRLMATRHPTLSLVRQQINLEDYLFPTIKNKLDEMAGRGVELLGVDRLASLSMPNASSNLTMISIVKSTSIKSALNKFGVQSLAFLGLRTRGRIKIGDLNANELRSIERFIDKNIFQIAIDHAHLNLPRINVETNRYYYEHKFIDLGKLSSKQIRTSRAICEPICVFKLGPILTPTETMNWGMAISALTSTRHKDVLLRLLHGELYSKERLHRYGLTPDPSCPRCGDLETLSHKYLECPYVKQIWKQTLKLTETMRNYPQPNEELADKIFTVREPNKISLTVHAEIITKIRYFKDEPPNSLLLPKLLVKVAIENLIRKELNAVLKNELRDLLE